jgi:hypothetical protein
MSLHKPVTPDAVALVGFLLGSGFVGLVVLFVTGAALTDPGGWRSIGLTAAWLLSRSAHRSSGPDCCTS